MHILEYGLQVIDPEITEVSGFAKCGFWADESPYGADTADAAESAWTVCLHFAELEATPPGERVFDIKLQGETVLRDFDIARTSGIPRAAIAREFEVRAGPVLQVELVPHPAAATRALPPILSAIELERTNTR